MKSVIKKRSATSIELKAKATSREVDAALDESIMQLAYEMHVMPRQGATTAELLAEKLGVSDVDRVVSDQAIGRLVPYALDKHDIHPLSQPRTEHALPLRRGFDFEFGIVVEPKPVYELESYEPVEIQAEEFAFDERLVDEQLAHIVDRFVDFEPIDDRPVAEGDNCFLKLEVEIDGVADPRFNTDGRVYSMGKGYMPSEFDESLLGMVPGQKKTIEFDAEYTARTGMPAHGSFRCETELLGLRKKTVPALADEWVAEHVDGYDNLEQLRAATREQLVLEQRERYERDLRDKVVEKFAERFNGDVPEAALDMAYNAILDGMKTAVAARGESFVEYVDKMGGEAEVDKAITLRAKMTVAQDYSLDALFRHLSLAIEEQDYIEAGLEMNPNDPYGVKERMEASGRGFAMREIASRIRAARWLKDNSRIEYVAGEGR